MPKSHPIVSYATRRRWTVADARAALSALDASGMSPCAFASSKGLDAQRLYRWRRRLGTFDVVPTPAFVEVKRQAVEPVEVVLRSGRILRVSESIDDSALRRLVHALENDPAC